jgi:hypothetical protein
MGYESVVSAVSVHLRHYDSKKSEDSGSQLHNEKCIWLAFVVRAALVRSRGAR